MKRKKWSEAEEQTLISKYSDLLQSGVLPKLKTREKKFKPIADEVNSQHHIRDPITFPFKWTWRDISIKIQNMRHQYIGVKQKIRTPAGQFDWEDGQTHWDNFSKYRQVFGDIQLSDPSDTSVPPPLDCEFEADSGEEPKPGSELAKLRAIGNRVLELRGIILRREIKRCETEFFPLLETARKNKNNDDEEEEMKMSLVRRMGMGLREGKKRKMMEMEEGLEEEEMEWKERMFKMQIEHEKRMLQIQGNAVQNQMEIMAALLSHFLGSPLKQ